MRPFYQSLLLVTIIICCNQTLEKNPEKFMNEIATAEAAFEKMEAEKGMLNISIQFFSDD